MPSTPPRFLPTLALAVLWVAVYLLWLAVRPADQATGTQTRASTPAPTTSTTGPPLLRFKP